MANQVSDFILIVDDDVELAEDFGLYVEKQSGLPTKVVHSAKVAVEAILEYDPVLIFLDLFLRGEKGGTEDSLALLQTLRKRGVSVPVVIITSYPDIPHVVDTIKAGATDFLPRPLGEHKSRLKLIIRNAVALRRSLAEAAGDEFAILGDSPAIHALRDRIRRAARSDVDILIVGETGTGKELVAHAVHNQSARSDHPLIKVLASAVPAGLYESELFGHRRGAFSGADTEREGAIASAGRGSLFLDEITEMPHDAQAKLLSVLESGDYSRVGENVSRKRQCRIVAASNRNLETLVADGYLRHDLFTRFDFVIQLPPLRERKEDIPLLARHFVMRFARDEFASLPVLTETAIELLIEQEYPGNVRDLRKVIRNALLLSDDPVIDADFLRAHWPPGSGVPVEKENTLDAAKKAAEREAIIKALEACDGNRTQAARRLRISRQRLHELIRQHRIH